MPLQRHAEALERLYARYNRPEYVRPDPLEYVLCYPEPEDAELAALLAAGLALGNVRAINRSLARVLGRLGDRPLAFVTGAGARTISAAMDGIKHRFITGDHLAALLVGARRTIRRWGSLEACFAAGLRESGRGVPGALGAFVRELRCGGDCGALLPDPAKGSACKRLNLMLRWMVRRDAVDPGPWRSVRAADLVVPLDTHMHRIGRAFGATARRAADMRAALEITDAFRRIRPDDPVRYDFALTRLGIRHDADLDAFLRDAAEGQLP